MTTEQELNEKLAGYLHWEHAPWYLGTGPDFTHSLDACLSLLLPLTEMDILWIIHDPKGRRYAFGYSRGEMNDVVCWSKTLPIEDCLSPICDKAAMAVCRAIDLALCQKSKNGAG